MKRRRTAAQIGLADRTQRFACERRRTMGKLERKVAIITGASKGIGEGIARTFARYGAKIVLAARGEKVLQLAEELKSQGYEAIGVQTDVSNEKSAQQLVSAAIDAYGTVDILVNNAGICTLEEFDAPDNVIRDRHIDINIKGVWNVTKAVLPWMKEKRDGRIVVMSSVTGYMVADPGEAAYAMTKAALIGFTRAMAREVADYNIRVNAIAPGFFITNQNTSLLLNPDGSYTARAEKIITHTPMGKFGTPEDLTGTLLWLCDNASSGFVNGVVVPVDGGFAAYSGV